MTTRLSNDITLISRSVGVDLIIHSVTEITESCGDVEVTIPMEDYLTIRNALPYIMKKPWERALRSGMDCVSVDEKCLVTIRCDISRYFVGTGYGVKTVLLRVTTCGIQILERRGYEENPNFKFGIKRGHITRIDMTNDFIVELCDEDADELRQMFVCPESTIIPPDARRILFEHVQGTIFKRIRARASGEQFEMIKRCRKYPTRITNLTIEVDPTLNIPIITDVDIYNQDDDDNGQKQLQLYMVGSRRNGKTLELQKQLLNAVYGQSAVDSGVSHHLMKMHERIEEEKHMEEIRKSYQGGFVYSKGEIQKYCPVGLNTTQICPESTTRFNPLTFEDGYKPVEFTFYNVKLCRSAYVGSPHFLRILGRDAKRFHDLYLGNNPGREIDPCISEVFQDTFEYDAESKALNIMLSPSTERNSYIVSRTMYGGSVELARATISLGRGMARFELKDYQRKREEESMRPSIMARYTANDAMATYGAYQAMRKSGSQPWGHLNIKNVIFNDPATIVEWHDGSKTVVRTQNGEKFDPEKGLAMAISKRALGDTREYYETFKRWVGKYEKSLRKGKVKAKPEDVKKTKKGGK